jgi:hypothetical protein
MIFEIKTPELKLVKDVSIATIEAHMDGKISVKDANQTNKACDRLFRNFKKKLSCTASELPNIIDAIASDMLIVDAMKLRLDRINSDHNENED